MRVLAPHPSALLRAPPGLRCGECVSMATDGRLPKDPRPTLSIDDLLSLSLDEGPALELDGPSRDRVAAYLRALLAYNERALKHKLETLDLLEEEHVEWHGLTSVIQALWSLEVLELIVDFDLDEVWWKKFDQFLLKLVLDLLFS